jgi:hypothetical protein
MTDDNQRNGQRCIVQKDLDDCDRTDGHRSGHYSREGVTALCHATEGSDHD